MDSRYAAAPAIARWLRSILLPLLPALFSTSCSMDRDQRTISGVLQNTFECVVVSSASGSWEIRDWESPPPLGSFVRLRVEELHGYASHCMVGPIARVIRVEEVRTDFRTHPVTSDETWGPDDEPISLGHIEVRPGVTLTILPGTTVQISTYGELRVRGRLIAMGTPSDSIRFVAPSGLGVVLDSVEAGSSLGYASLTRLRVEGPASPLANLSVGYLDVAGGDAEVTRSRLDAAGVDGGVLRLHSSMARHLGATQGVLHLEDVELSSLDLSYSTATVTASRFTGERARIVFQGPSGGVFERNRFTADTTTVELRHDANPRFTDNDLARTSVQCVSRTIGTCVDMTGNWWGTADGSALGARIGTCVCYAPWRTSPVFPVPRP